MASSLKKASSARNCVAPSEAQLVRWWAAESFRQGWLQTVGGQRLKVLFPGWATSGAGPDFRNALLETEAGQRWQGDVEVHRDARDFRSHGHHRDSRYGGVILHVVHWAGGEGETTLPSGGAAPVVAVQEPAFPNRQPSLFPLPCRDAVLQLGQEAVIRVLEQAGRDWFLSRAAELAEDLHRQPPEEVLYQRLMEALGYSRNKGPFLELARRLPLQRLRGLVAGVPGGQVPPVLEGALLAVSGLGPGVPEVADIPALERGQWDLFRVRPSNAPQRRIAAAAFLWARMLRDGPVQALRRLLMGDYHPWEVARRLTAALTTPSQASTPGGLGAGRAGLMVVNGVLPFFCAWGQALEQEAISERALEVFTVFPALEENAVTRLMASQLGISGKGLLKGACRLQGLLHLHKGRCWELRCAGCPLNSQGKLLREAARPPFTYQARAAA